MRLLLSKLLLAVSLFVTASIANAALFGFTTTVRATDGTDSFSQTISSGTFASCERLRHNLVSLWNSMGYMVTSNPPCIPVAMDSFDYLDKFRALDRFDDIDLTRPWPWPVCLSCPYLIPDVIDRIYPEAADKVKQLMEGYGIDQYNVEIQKLQERYNLQSFESEMHDLQLQMDLESQKR